MSIFINSTCIALLLPIIFYFMNRITFAFHLQIEKTGISPDVTRSFSIDRFFKWPTQTQTYFYFIKELNKTFLYGFLLWMFYFFFPEQKRITECLWWIDISPFPEHAFVALCQSWMNLCIMSLEFFVKLVERISYSSIHSEGIFIVYIKWRTQTSCCRFLISMNTQIMCLHGIVTWLSIRSMVSAMYLFDLNMNMNSFELSSMLRKKYKHSRSVFLMNAVARLWS